MSRATRAARTVRTTRTRSTVKSPGETIPGAVRRPSGPPTSSVKFRSSRSLRLGTTSRVRLRFSGGIVSCMPRAYRGRRAVRGRTGTASRRCRWPLSPPGEAQRCRLSRRLKGRSPRVAAWAPCGSGAMVTIGSSFAGYRDGRRPEWDGTASTEQSHLMHCEVDVFAPLLEQPGVELRFVPDRVPRVEDQYVFQLSDHGGHLLSGSLGVLRVPAWGGAGMWFRCDGHSGPFW